MRVGRAGAAATAWMIAWVTCGCAGVSREDADRSHAADALIDEAKTPEERAQLEKVRDEVDAAAKKRIQELDAEIERLRRENEELRKRAR